MRLKIKARPVEDGGLAIGTNELIEVVDMDTGESMLDQLRSIQIDIGINDVVTAKLEYYVTELDLEGIDGTIEKMKEYKDGE